MIFIFFLIQVPLRFLLAFFPETCGRCASLGWRCIPLRSQHLQCVLLPHRLCSLTQGCVCLPEPCWILHSLAGKPTLRHQKPAAGSGRLRGLGERGPRETVWDSLQPVRRQDWKGAPKAFLQGGYQGRVQACSFPSAPNWGCYSSPDAMGRYCEHLIKGETQVELPQTPAQAMPFLASVSCGGTFREMGEELHWF